MKKENRKLALGLAMVLGILELLSPIISLVDAEQIFEENTKEIGIINKSKLDREDEFININEMLELPLTTIHTQEEKVDNFEDLEMVLKNNNIENIEIVEDIDFEKTLHINRDIKINSKDRKILKASQSRHFKIEESGKLTLDNLIISGDESKDNYSGGIENYGNLIIENSIFENNYGEEGGAIYNKGELISNSNLEFINNEASNGGAIYNKGRLVASGLLDFKENKALNGGAIYNIGLIQSSNSNFESNEAKNGRSIYNMKCKDIHNSGVLYLSASNIKKEDIYEGDQNSKVTVSFDSNGGSNVESQNLYQGENATEPSEPSKANYSFKGWYVNKDLSGKRFKFESPIEENITLYASWEENSKVTVNFNSNGGSKVAEQTVYKNKQATEPQAPTKLNYSFKGWYFNKDLSGEKFNFESPIKEDIILYASWEENSKVTVNFNSNGGSKVESQNLYQGENATEPSEPSKANYSFKGWYFNKDLSGEKFDFESPIKEDITLYASWEENKLDRVSLTLDANGGKFSNGLEKIILEESKNTRIKISDLEKPTKVYNNFDYWTNKDGNRIREEITLTEDIRLRAEWLNKSYISKEEKDEKENNYKNIDENKVEDNEIKEGPNRKYHSAYIKGYPDSTVRPENNITRKEAMTVFYRLMDKEYRKVIASKKNKFMDMDFNTWSYGYISRAEFMRLIFELDELENIEEDIFIDTKGHWASKYINTAFKKGWISGYEDGNFKPDKNISRAEFVKVTNRFLGREVNKNKKVEESIIFKDLDKDKWYYYDILEATKDYYIE